MPVIHQLKGCEILDSRGRPTVKAMCSFASGVSATASVPSGASTGAAEACELRDGDPKRYRGSGCRNAAAHLAGEMTTALGGRRVETQAEWDRALLDLDGTPNKSRLGANAILAASLAFARAHALDRGLPLYQHFADMSDLSLKSLPRLTINLFSGGKHAGGQVCIQDVLLVPASAATVDDSLAMTWEIYQCAAELVRNKYGMRALRADEGGLAPPFTSAEAMIEDAIQAIQAAGLAPGRDVSLAVDVAASHFYENGLYQMGDTALPGSAMIDHLVQWLADYPIVSLEDGLAEDDWAEWPVLHARAEGRALVLGDDFLCTNPARIRRAIESQACDALLLKVNQIGTLSEACEACQLARAAGWRVTVSARSGETEDDWLADLAVGWAGDQIKIGSITQSERLAKYNRLLEIEASTRLPLVPWPRASS